MEKVQSAGWRTKFFKKPAFILFLILAGFFFKELFLAAIFPIFSGQDESRHYNTIQFLAEPKEKTWDIIEKKDNNKEKQKLETYNFSQEIKETARLEELYVFREENYTKPSFSEGYIGKNEEEINKNSWSHYNKNYPPDIAGVSNSRLYHLLSVQIEKFFSQQSILVRFYLIRTFSILLGTMVILIAYFTAKNVGFNYKESLLMSAIIAFQPKFSTYIMNINYDSLVILIFSLFTLGAIYALRQGLNWKNLSILIISISAGLFTKGTTIILLPIFFVLLGIFIYKKIKNNKLDKKYLFLITILSLIALTILFNNYSLLSYFPYGEDHSISKVVSSLGDYLSESLSKVQSSSKNYWGNLNWTQVDASESLINVIWLAEIFSAVGLIMFLFKKNKPDFLPEKKFIILLLAIAIMLQFGIRFYDWRIFSQTGGLDLGTPGRYFFPSIVSHIILVCTGLGMLLKKREYFHNALIAGFILMLAFSFYLTLVIIMPRFYL